MMSQIARSAAHLNSKTSSPSVARSGQKESATS